LVADHWKPRGRESSAGMRVREEVIERRVLAA